MELGAGEVEAARGSQNERRSLNRARGSGISFTIMGKDMEHIHGVLGHSGAMLFCFLWIA